MQKLIDSYEDATFIPSFRNLYQSYRAGHPKHRYWLANRKQAIAKLDLYDQYILENLNPGKTLAYDISGYYLNNFIRDLVIVEKDPVVLTWAPECILESDQLSLDALHGTIDNLIVINIVDLRWKNIEYWTEWWLKKAVYFKPGCQIMFSFRENRLLRNRLKIKFSNLMDKWLQTMETHGFMLKRYSYDPCAVDELMTNYKHAPEIVDIINGNLKIHWEYNG